MIILFQTAGYCLLSVTRVCVSIIFVDCRKLETIIIGNNNVNNQNNGVIEFQRLFALKTLTFGNNCCISVKKLDLGTFVNLNYSPP